MHNEREEFKARIAELLRWTDDLRLSVLSSGGVGIERERFSRAAITVLLVGSFEYHLKQLVQRFIVAVNKMKIPFSQLPEPVRRCHLECGAEILRSTAKRERQQARQNNGSPSYTESHKVSAQLASVDRGVPYELVTEAYALTQANPGPDVVRDILRNLNTEQPWPTIARNAPNLYTIPGIKSKLPEERDLGQLEGLLRNNLKNLLEARNRCAHGALDTPPDLSTLQGYLDAVDAISEGIFSTLKGELAQLHQSPLEKE